MEHQAYRCCLPTLAGFAGNHCIGPDVQRRPTVCSPTPLPPRGIPPSCSGLLAWGTATSPPSTTKSRCFKKLEPMVGIGLPTLEFPKILKPYIQQRGDYSSTNPELLSHYTFSTPLLTVLLTPLAAIPVLVTGLEPEAFCD